MKKILLVLLVGVLSLISCNFNKEVVEALKVEKDSLQNVINAHIPTACDTTITTSVTVHKTVTTYVQDTIPVQDTTFVSDTNWVNLWIEIPDTVIVTVYDTVDVPKPHKCIFKK